MTALEENASGAQQADDSAQRMPASSLPTSASGERNPASTVTLPVSPIAVRPRERAIVAGDKGPLILLPLLPFERDSYASTALGDVIDRSLNAAAARFTAGLSPAALAEAWFDWLVHLATAPGKRIQLLEKAVKKAARLVLYSHAQA